MRLIKTSDSINGHIHIESYTDHNHLQYAILSHVWGEEEVSLQDVQLDLARGKKGFAKIRDCCTMTRGHNLNYAWIDTCCIDKSSSAELSEAINTMYRWYENAAVCYAYLSDVSSVSDLPNSRWFTRGWTLQELIAPEVVIFFDKDWNELGTKESLKDVISERTGIPVGILLGDESLDSASIAQRMSWASTRVTTRIEDQAYSLLGLFDINMPLIYGEGKRAFIRLQEEIMRVWDDHTIFAWKSADQPKGGLLATSPEAFADSANVVAYNPFLSHSTSPLVISNKGIHVDFNFIGLASPGIGLALLHCTNQTGDNQLIAIWLKDVSMTMERFERIFCDRLELVDIKEARPSQYPVRRICVQQHRQDTSRRSRRLLSKKGPTTQYSHPTTCGDNSKETILFHEDKLISLLNDVNLSVSNAVLRTPSARVPTRENSLLSPDESDNNTSQPSNGLTSVLQHLRLVVGSLAREGRNPLSYAAEKGDINLLWLLLTRTDFNADSADVETGKTPLIWAAAHGQTHACRQLLNSGVALESQDNECKTALCWAAETGHCEIIQLLVEKGADLEWRSRLLDQVPLTLAVGKGHQEAVKLLITLGAKLNDKGSAALSHAAYHGDLEMVRLLIEQHADLEPDENRSPLLLAVERGHAAVVQLLLERGAHVDNINTDSATPLYQASGLGNEPIVRLLLLYGAAPDYMTPGMHRPALFYAAEQGHAAVVELLLDSGAKLLVPNKTGYTELTIAAKNGHLAVVEVLLNRGADIEEIAGYGNMTALLLAASSGHTDVVEFLLKKKANRSARDRDGRTALILAATGGHKETVHFLLREGFDIEERATKQGMTALLAAVWHGKDDCARQLVEEGACLDSENNARETALTLATRLGKKELAKFLREKGAK